MKTLITILVCLVSTATLSQSKSEVQESLDSILLQKIKNYRSEFYLPELINSDILKKSSQHHSTYMSTTRIVSHYQKMNLVSMKSIYSPRKRIAYFANDIITNDNQYGEIVLAVKSASDNLQETADLILSTIIESENLSVLRNTEARYIGLTTVKRKNYYYTTINFAIGYNNIIALVDL